MSTRPLLKLALFGKIDDFFSHLQNLLRRFVPDRGNDLHKSVTRSGVNVEEKRGFDEQMKFQKRSDNYAGVTRRFCAYLIDVVAQLIFIGLVALLLELQSFFGLLSSGLILFSCAWLYFAYQESSKWQATLGKYLLGIKVVDHNGGRITFKRATGRFFGKILSRFLFGIGFLLIFFTKKKQCLHDKLTKTFILKSN